MGTGDTVTITLTGGAPWGFRLQGGGAHPLKVSKIRKKSQAHAQGMKEGDTILSINGVTTSGRSHDEAMRFVDMSGDALAIEISRGNMPDVHTVPGSYAPVINGHSSAKQDEGRSTATTSSFYDDGNRKGSVQTQTFVEKKDGKETRGYVRSEQMSSVVQDQWAPTHAPLPSLLDTSLSKQPYSSKPVQVQVSAMFSGPKDDMKENVAPQGYSSPAKTAPTVPMFNVRKVSTTSSSTVSKKETWQPQEALKPQPSMWQAQQQQNLQSQESPQSHIWSPTPSQVTPPKPEMPIMRVRDIKKQLLSPRSYDEEDEDHLEEEEHHKHHHSRLHVFAPPVQISLHAGEREDHDLELVRSMSTESDISSPTSSLGTHKKLFSDSAFYNDPEKNFPTIQEQMKLCKIIAQSLTSAANKKARGARMFAKRQKRAPKWVHDGTVLPYDIYLPEDEPLLSFKIPSVKNRVSSPDTESKMSLTQEEFEKMRLESQKCDHQVVSPNQCFDIAQSLKHSKGKAGKLFERRRQRSEKYVIDETNAQKAPVKVTQIGGGFKKPLKGSVTPWEAALENPDGSVEAAFEQLSEFERKQKLNQMLKFTPKPAPTPAPKPTPHVNLPPMNLHPLPLHSSLIADQPHILQGRDFNRKARGWHGGSEDRSCSPNFQSSPTPSYPTPQPKPPVQFRDYNPRPKAWRTSGDNFDSQYPGNLGYGSPYASDSSNIMSPTGYHTPQGYGQPQQTALPGTDL